MVFCLKMTFWTSFLTYKISAYGGVSGGFVYTVNYQKEDDGPWHLVCEGFDGSLAFHIHADFGFASYDYTKELL